MEAQQATTDELVSEYTNARHKHAIATGEETEIAVEAIQESMDVEDELASRGVSKEKVREFWRKFAEKHGLDH